MVKISNTHHRTKDGLVKKNPQKKTLIKLSYPRAIKKNGNVYKIMLVTKEYVFYGNDEDSDDNANTLMYDRNMRLLSDNYFAFTGLIDDIVKYYPKRDWVWISRTLNYDVKNIYEDYKEE